MKLEVTTCLSGRIRLYGGDRKFCFAMTRAQGLALQVFCANADHDVSEFLGLAAGRNSGVEFATVTDDNWTVLFSKGESIGGMLVETAVLRDLSAQLAEVLASGPQ